MVAFFKQIELRRTIRAPLLYALMVWLLVQLVITSNPPSNSPHSFSTAVFLLLASGLLIALVLGGTFRAPTPSFRATTDTRFTSPGRHCAIATRNDIRPRPALSTIRGTLIPICAMLTSACVTTFDERHYFQTIDSRGEVTNYYRLDVDGYAAFSAARYVSGYYDERAVDLFFDEVQMAPTTTETPNERTLFSDLSTDVTFEPLSPNADQGAFVMVLSNNASAVTSTIGQFAENQIVAEAITNLANRDLIVASQGGGASPLVEAEQAAALAQEIAALMNLVPNATDSPNQPETERALLRVLTAIARARGHDRGFNSFADARAWFEAQRP